jgi:hypothetical protein
MFSGFVNNNKISASDNFGMITGMQTGGGAEKKPTSGGECKGMWPDEEEVEEPCDLPGGKKSYAEGWAIDKDPAEALIKANEACENAGREACKKVEDEELALNARICKLNPCKFEMEYNNDPCKNINCRLISASEVTICSMNGCEVTFSGEIKCENTYGRRCPDNLNWKCIARGPENIGDWSCMPPVVTPDDSTPGGEEGRGPITGGGGGPITGGGGGK